MIAGDRRATRTAARKPGRIGAVALAWAAIALMLLAAGALAPDTETVVPVEPCDAGLRRCTAELPQGGRIELDLTPLPVAASRPLHLRIAVSGSSPDGVEAVLTGVDMNMGEDRVVLTRTAAGVFEGDTNLAVCVTARMTWQARVRVRDGGKVVAVPFRFETGPA